jgi:hypothetical protein
MHSGRLFIKNAAMPCLATDLPLDLSNMLYDVCEQMVIEHQDGDYEGFKMEMTATWALMYLLMKNLP